MEKKGGRNSVCPNVSRRLHIAVYPQAPLLLLVLPDIYKHSTFHHKVLEEEEEEEEEEGEEEKEEEEKEEEQNNLLPI